MNHLCPPTLLALALALSGCATPWSFIELGEREAQHEIDEVVEARVVHDRGRSYVVGTFDEEGVDLPQGFRAELQGAWPERPVEVTRRSPWRAPDPESLTVAYTDTTIFVIERGQPRAIEQVRGTYLRTSPVPYLLLPLTVAVDVAFFPVTLPAYLYFSSASGY